MFEELVNKLKFTDKEAKIYLAILEHGKLSAHAISRITGINRTTVYSATKELLKRGLVTEDLGSSFGRYYSALQIENLRKIYLEDEKRVKEKKDAVEKLLKDLSLTQKSKNYSVPKVRFIDEANVGDFLHKQLPVWVESAKGIDQNWWGFQDVSLIENYPEWVEYHWKTVPGYFGMRVFTNKKPAEEKIASKDLGRRRQVKYWDKSVEFTGTHVVIGNYVLFIMTKQHPHYIVETHDPVMAENLRKMFQAIWKEVD